MCVCVFGFFLSQDWTATQHADVRSRNDGLQPSLVTYGSFMSACEAGVWNARVYSCVHIFVGEPTRVGLVMWAKQ